MASDSDKQIPGHATPGPAAGRAQSPVTEAPEFANTEVQEREEFDPQWWSESTDGRCSEDAALFAASQPAPLSVV